MHDVLKRSTSVVIADARGGESPVMLSNSYSYDRPEELQPAPCDRHILRLLTDRLTAAVWCLYAG